MVRKAATTIEEATQALEQNGYVETKSLEDLMSDTVPPMSDDFVPYYERYQAIKEQLAAPFPDEVIEYKPTNFGKRLAYAPWDAYTKRLNELAFGHWSARISNLIPTTEGTIITTVVEIFGQAQENVSDPDTPSSAYAQALKRTCALHGLGLYLYENDTPKPPTPTTNALPSAQATTTSYSGGTGKPTPKMRANLIDRNKVPAEVVDSLTFEQASGMLNDFIQGGMSLKSVADKYGFSVPSDGLPVRSR